MSREESIPTHIVPDESPETGLAGVERITKVGIAVVLLSIVMFIGVAVVTTAGEPGTGTGTAIKSKSMFESKTSEAPFLTKDEHPYHGSFNMDTCGCDLGSNGDACSDASYPVMGGLDPVQYFSFDEEGMVGDVGSSDYQYTYAGYTYYFLNDDNKQTFISNPDKYKPQWGGFCSWGMSAEFCPNFTWSSSCLGPNGNWGIWTIQEDQSDSTEKLYFFYLHEVRDSFLANMQYYMDQGNKRWEEWFEDTDPHMNTVCYFKNAEESWVRPPDWMGGDRKEVGLSRVVPSSSSDVSTSPSNDAEDEKDKGIEDVTGTTSSNKQNKANKSSKPPSNKDVKPKKKSSKSSSSSPKTKP